MSDTIHKIFERNRRVHDIDGIEFVCHRWSASLAIEAFGANAFSLVGDGGNKTRVEVDAAQLGDRQQVVERVLRVAMIDPVIGDADDEGRGVVTMRTLGDLAYTLYEQILGSTVEEAANFPESSAAEME